MSTDRIAVVEDNLDAFLAAATAAPGRMEGDAPRRPEGGLAARQAVGLFEDQVLCRALDVTARRLKRRDLGETGYRGRLRSVRAEDSCVPLGPSAAAVLVSEAGIVAAVREAAS